MTELQKLLDLIEEAAQLHKPAGAPSAEQYLERIWLQASRVRLPASRPDPLCQVLNEGDGSYRP